MQLPDYNPFPMYQPTLTVGQVVTQNESKGKDLLQKLLICNPVLRVTSDEAMAHPYFSDLPTSMKHFL